MVTSIPFSVYARYKGPESYDVNLIFPCIPAYALDADNVSLKIMKQYDFPGSITMPSTPPYGKQSSSNCSCCKPVTNPAFATITYCKQKGSLKIGLC